MNNKPERDAILFSKHYKKLDLSYWFHTVRWMDKSYSLGKTYDILLKDSAGTLTMGTARCFKLEMKRLSDLGLEFCLRDADCTREEFFRMMEVWYSKKPDWKGWDSWVQVVYLEWMRKEDQHANER